MAPRRNDPGDGNGARAAAHLRNATIFLSPIIVATAIAVSTAVTIRINTERDLKDLRRDLEEERAESRRLRSDFNDRIQFVDRDGIRDPVVRMAIDNFVAEIMRRKQVLTREWMLRVRDINPALKIPETE